MKNLVKKISVSVALLLASFGAFAAVPAGAATALGELATDVTTVAGLAFTAFLVIVLFAYMRRAAH
jgi:hypothetical protein